MRSLFLGMIGGVRIGRPSGMAEQGGDGEPVGQAAYHRRLRKSADEAPGGMNMVERLARRNSPAIATSIPVAMIRMPADAALRRVQRLEGKHRFHRS
jgi:hypothetical protein